MKGKLTKVLMVAMMLVTMLGLATTALTVSTTTVSAATNQWSRMDLPTTLNYQMFPDSAIWDLTAAADGTLFALVEDTTGAVDVAAGGKMVWDGLRWAIYPAYSDIAVFKSTNGGYSWSLMWHVPASETGAPIAVVPQPGYSDQNSAMNEVFLAMGSRYISGNSTKLASYAGGLSQGNIYYSRNGGASFTRVNPRCPAVVLAVGGVPNTGGTITSLDVVQCPVCSTGCQNPYMAIVGVSSLDTSTGGAGGCGEGVWTWNQNGTAVWNDLQVSDALPGFGTPPMPGTMPAGNGLDVIAVMGSRNYTTDGLIAVTANDILAGDPAGEPAGIYVCFYDANTGIWGGDPNSPTNAITHTTGVPWVSVVPWLTDYAGAASMATGTDFDSLTSCYVFVGIDGSTLSNDVWRVRGLATVTGPSTVTSCAMASVTRISDVMIPAAASTAVYVGCEFPLGQAQEFDISNAITWPTPVPSFKPTSGAWPVFVTNMSGTVMAAGGGDGLTTSGVHKMVVAADGTTAFNGVGLLDDIAVSEDVPGYAGKYPAGSSWCLAEAVSEEVSPTYATDGLIYIATDSEWFNTQHPTNTSLSLWRLTNGNWERVMYENITRPDGYQFRGKDMLTNVDQNTFVTGWTWWPRVVPQFSTDQTMFLLGGRSTYGKTATDLRELIWYSPDEGNSWKFMPQMPIGAMGWAPTAAGLSESGWWVQDSNTLIIGDVGGWIYKTTNRGASWTDGALTGTSLEITMIRPSPIYNESGAAGTDKCLIVGTYDKHTLEDQAWLSQDGAINDLKPIGDEVYTNPSWALIPLGGTVVNFDKNWATNHIVYAMGGGWLDEWQLVGAGAGGTQDLNRIDYTDTSVVRTTVDLTDPSASTWKTLYGAGDWNSVAPKPQPLPGMVLGQSLYRSITPSGLQIGPDGTVYVTYSIWDESYNYPGANPTPKSHIGRYTYAGILRCLDGTATTTEWNTLRDGLGPWDGLYLNRVEPGTSESIAISLAFDWKEWIFKLAFWNDTLSGAGPAPVVPLTNANGVGALLADGTINVPLSWQAQGNASLYEWQVSEDSAFAPANTITGTTSGLGVTVLGLKPSTTYFWRVRASEPTLGRWNTAQQFTTVIGGSSGAPQLITPAVGSTISDKTPLFTWTGISSATNYEIQVATSPTFAAADIVFDTTLGNVQAYQSNQSLVNGTYYWHIKGTSSATVETPWSALGSFVLNTSLGHTTTPAWVWVLIVLGILLGVVVLVLILRTRRPV